MGQLDTLAGKVIMFDGPDYVGKTTQLKLAASALEDAGLQVFTARYNGGTPIGEALRQAMFGDYDRPPETDMHINIAQQYALAQVLQSERAKRSVILIDRSPLSFIAYQVFGDGLDKSTGNKAADEVLALHTPELLVCFEAPEALLAKRRKADPHKMDYFESKPSKYFERVAAGYKQAVSHYGAKVIDASGSIDAVHALTMQAIGELA